MRKRLILIIDDDPDDRLLMRRAIEQTIKTVFVVEAQNAQEACKWLLQDSKLTNFDLVLLDMNMPGINGLEMITSIRSATHTQHIPIVMISTSDSPKQVQESYARGANAYIVKPYSSIGYQAIVDAIETCFLKA
ncbi:response regulator [Nostoc sp. CHAB 5834]|nr:response regulator [Nostoc sp. CHAB 5834]